MKKGDDLVAALGGKAEAVSLEAVSRGEVTGDVLMNSTSIGMHDTEGQSPVGRQSLADYQLVFDAIYTPLRTQLIQVAAPRPTTCHTIRAAVAGKMQAQLCPSVN